jgi:hypothetical protein
VKKLHQMAQGLALAGSVYAAALGLAVTTAGRATADGPDKSCISDIDIQNNYLGCGNAGWPCATVINGKCGDNRDFTACWCVGS